METKECQDCNIVKNIDCFQKNKKYYRKQCKDCYKKQRTCIHNIKKQNCKECGGGSICEHKKIRTTCKKCIKKCTLCNKNKSLSEFYRTNNKCKDCCKKKATCIHNKRKTYCKECKGGGICEHDKIRIKCKECKGSQICEHDKVRTFCKECKGGSFCEHDKRRDTCKECGGSAFCLHDKRKTDCKDCNGVTICKHKKRKDRCKICKGTGICQHNRDKSICKECGGSQICEHDKRKSQCRICSPNSNKFCKQCRLFYVTKNTNYLCSYCNPDKPARIKVRELKVKTFLEENQYDFEYNKYCKYQEYGYFPDFKIKSTDGNFWIIIECDEFGHRIYDKKDEKIREINICLALNKPCVFLRYNPDKKGVKIITKEKILKSYIEYYKNKDIKENTIDYLFY